MGKTDITQETLEQLQELGEAIRRDGSVIAQRSVDVCWHWWHVGRALTGDRALYVQGTDTISAGALVLDARESGRVMAGRDGEEARQALARQMGARWPLAHGTLDRYPRCPESSARPVPHMRGPRSRAGDDLR